MEVHGSNLHAAPLTAVRFRGPLLLPLLHTSAQGVPHKMYFGMKQHAFNMPVLTMPCQCEFFACVQAWACEASQASTVLLHL